MIYRILFCILFSTICTFARPITHSENKHNKLIGEFQLQTSSTSGSGSITVSKTDSIVQINIYSPFGSKIAKLTHQNDTISIITQEKTIQLNSSDSIELSSILPVKIIGNDLFQLLSGNIPDFIRNLPLNHTNTVFLSKGAHVKSVVKFGKLKKIIFNSPEYQFQLKRYNGAQFRSINLNAGSTNYFHIAYE